MTQGVDAVGLWFCTNKWNDYSAAETPSFTLNDTVDSFRRLELCPHNEPFEWCWPGQPSRISVVAAVALQQLLSCLPIVSQTLSLALLKFDRQLLYCCNLLQLMHHYMTCFVPKIKLNNGLYMDVTYSSMYTDDSPFSRRTRAFIIITSIVYYRGETLHYYINVVNHYKNDHYSRSWWSHEEYTTYNFKYKWTQARASYGGHSELVDFISSSDELLSPPLFYNGTWSSFGTCSTT